MRGQSNYAASKAGLIGFTKSVARELASRGITAKRRGAGFIVTDMTQALGPEMQEQLKLRIALGRLGTGDDVANVVLFLASELAGYVDRAGAHGGRRHDDVNENNLGGRTMAENQCKIA